MADKIVKFLRKLSTKELELVNTLMTLIVTNKLEGLDCKQLKGQGNVFRVRKGRLRIVFRKMPDGEINFLLITHRDDQTYKNL